ncbi:hypothetical protein RND71_022022 [Anisodus tanguticus]|uniref:Uncharacterized protein n=1 Tax=Anisodus tanguticus TaxID=243964 RepID=A0AAE1RZ72_9SOLA|nr:hypothetical protein RND71_022022 [Anisodus tanguticus]
MRGPYGHGAPPPMNFPPPPPPLSRGSFTQISNLRNVSPMIFPEREDKKYIYNCPVALMNCLFDLRMELNSFLAKYAHVDNRVFDATKQDIMKTRKETKQQGLEFHNVSVHNKFDVLNEADHPVVVNNEVISKEEYNSNTNDEE